MSGPPLKRIGVAAGRSVSVSSSDEGGPGRSGRPCGGEGVWNSSRELWKEGRFGGVDNKPRIVVEAASGSGGAVVVDVGGEGGGEGGGAVVRAFWNKSSSSLGPAG